MREVGNSLGSEAFAGIVDQDEFDELALSGHLTDSQVATATEVAQSLLPLVQMDAEPFGGAARAWLRSLRRSDPDQR